MFIIKEENWKRIGRIKWQLGKNKWLKETGTGTGTGGTGMGLNFNLAMDMDVVVVKTSPRWPKFAGIGLLRVWPMGKEATKAAVG